MKFSKPPYNSYTGQLFLKYLLISERYFGYILTARYYYRKRFAKDSLQDEFVSGKEASFIKALDGYISSSEKQIKINMELYGLIVPFVKKEFYNFLNYIFRFKFNVIDSYYDEAFSKTYTFLDLLMSFEGLLDDKSIINNFSKHEALILLNYKYKPVGKKSNKIDIKNLIKKGILKGDIEEYCSLKYNEFYLDENEKVVLKFMIVCPVSINIRKIVGQVEEFQEKAIIHNIRYTDIWDETCLKTYSAVIKIDLDKCKGSEIRVCVEVDNRFHLFNSVFEILD